jgi:hypothetical protein
MANLKIENVYLNETSLSEILKEMLLRSEACVMRLQDIAGEISKQEEEACDV